MSSLGPYATAIEIEDELVFQQTLLESMQDAPDHDESKQGIQSTILELENRLSTLAGNHAGRASTAETDTASTPSTDSNDSFTFVGAQKRPRPDSSEEQRPKRHAPNSLASSQAAINESFAARARQRQLEEERRASARRQIEEADAMFALQLSQAGEPSHTEPLTAAANHDFRRAGDMAGVSSLLPRTPQTTYQTSLYRPNPGRPSLPTGEASTGQSQRSRGEPTRHSVRPPSHPGNASSGSPAQFKFEPHSIPSHIKSDHSGSHDGSARPSNRDAEIVDLTGDDSAYPVLPLPWQQSPPNFGQYARSIHQNPAWSGRLSTPGANPTTMQIVDPHHQAMINARVNAGQNVYGNGQASSSHPQRRPPSIYEPQNTSRSFFDMAKGAMATFSDGVTSLEELFHGPSAKSRNFDNPWDDDPFDRPADYDPAELTEDLKNLMDNIRPDEELPVEERDVEMESMTITLKPYQGVGLTWLQNMEAATNKGGILADDMGLGKTVQAIALMSTRPSPDPANKTTLIVCPVALLRQWKEEVQNKLKRGRHSMSVFIHHGPQKKNTHQELRAFDVVLTTFGTLGTEVRKRDRYLRRKEVDRSATERPDEKCIFIAPGNKWYRVILDEAQNAKNRHTQASRGVCQLDAQYRLCMTGTPMMNSVDELYSLIKFLKIRPYNDWTKFSLDFSRPLKSSNDYGRDAAMKKLQALLKAILLRRHKKSKINGKPILILPECIVEQTPADFSPEERDFYTALEQQQRTQFNKYVKAGTVGKSYAHILVMLLRLRQACCHPHLVKDFGVQLAADISEEDMQRIAEGLDPGVVERIKNSNGEFECPVCYDAVDNPAIFVPCGHDTCADCYIKIKEAANEGASEAGPNRAKCPNCRGIIDPKQVIDYETFKKVHMPVPVEEEAQSVYAIQKTGSETESDPEATESDDSDDSGEEDDSESETESLDGFVVADDVEDDETDKKSKNKGKHPAYLADKLVDDSATATESEGEGPPKRIKAKKPVAAIFRRARQGGITFDSDDEGGSSVSTSDNKAKLIADKQPTAESLATAIVPCDDDIGSKDNRRKGKKRKSKKPRKNKTSTKGKGKEKENAPVVPKKKRAPQLTIAELKKLATRSKAAKKEYLQRIRKDFTDSAKISKCISLLRDIIETTDEKIIVFSQWTSLLDLLEIPVDEAGWSYTRYDGSMPAKGRADAVDEFKDPARSPRMRLMLVSLKAGNAGLNLNCASQVIILDPFWNPYIEEQAIDRAHRLGQEREVRVHRLLIEETVEDRIMALQQKKREMINEALDEGAAQRLSRLSQQELGFLFGVRPRHE